MKYTVKPTKLSLQKRLKNVIQKTWIRYEVND